MPDRAIQWAQEPCVTQRIERGDHRTKLLLTAGPTHEPIDAVRFIGNRSSGRLGVAVAEAAARSGWDVRLLLGPMSQEPKDSRVEVVRFRTTQDLESLLRSHVPWCDVLIMAAAVADYRPVLAEGALERKLRRTSESLRIDLEPTPDLLAGCASLRADGQTFVGFALEPKSELIASAKSKLERKRLDMIVANPLETMDGPTIEATILERTGAQHVTPGTLQKEDFAPWLLHLIEEFRHARS